MSVALLLILKRERGFLNKLLSIILAVAILGIMGALINLIITPKSIDKYTEFYILGPGGVAKDYPKELVPGEENNVVIAIVNHEYQTVSYKVEVTIDGARYDSVSPIVIHHGSEWQGEIDFKVDKMGDRQKVWFLLYKDGQSSVYRSLYLWVTVVE